MRRFLIFAAFLASIASIARAADPPAQVGGRAGKGGSASKAGAGEWGTDPGGTTKDRLVRRWSYEKKGQWAHAERESEFMMPRLRAMTLEKALAEIDDAARAYPDEPEVQFHRAEVYMAHDQFDKGMVAYSEVLDFEVRHEFDQSLRGEVLIVTAEIVLARDPKVDPIKQERADKLLYRARIELDEAIRLNPKYATAFNDRSILFVVTGNRMLAMRDANKAIELAPDNPRFYRGRSILHANVKEFDKQLKDLNAAIALAPTWSLARAERGLCYLDLGEFKKAIADYDEAIRLNRAPESPKNTQYVAEMHYLRGTCSVNVRDWTAAVRDLTTAIELNPTRPIMYENRAAAYRELGLADKAAADLRKAAALRMK